MMPNETGRVAAGAGGGLLSLAPLVVALAWAASPVHAQFVEPGAARAVMTDVTGPPVTSGDLVAGLFEPGTVRTFGCPVAWGVRTEAERLRAALAGGTLRAASAAPGGEGIDDEVQRELLLILLDEPGADEAEARFRAALAAGGGREARSWAGRLLGRLRGALAEASRMDPEEPGYRSATGLSAALGAYNAFLATGAGPVLRSPPPELVAIRTVLSRLVIAGVENEGRSAGAGDGRACAPAVTTSPTTAAAEPGPAAPAPPLERALEVCLLGEDRVVTVAAILVPSTGDTLAVVDGARRPFSEIHTLEPTAAGARWFVEQEAIEVEGQRYLQYGLPIYTRSAEFERLGFRGGVPLIAPRSGARPPETVYVPVGPACILQEYRLESLVRRVRG